MKISVGTIVLELSSISGWSRFAIGGAAFLLLLSATGLAYFAGPAPKQTTVRTTPTVSPTSSPASSATATPTPGTQAPPPQPTLPQPTPTPLPTTIGFTFETGIENWVTSEGSYKLATLSVATQPHHGGAQSLQVTTALRGDASAAYQAHPDPVYTHTEAIAYFNSAIPEGAPGPGPYNLNQKRVSCWANLPPALATGDSHRRQPPATATGDSHRRQPPATATGDSHPTYIRVFVKDTSFRNDYGPAVGIVPANTNMWINLSLVVGSPGSGDADGSHINTIGVRIETPSGSTLGYSGPLFIDDCTMQYP